MPIYFEYSMFHNVPYKQGCIDLDDKTKLHHSISTTNDNSRWFVAVSIQDISTGKVVSRTDLSKACKNYGEVVQHVAGLKAQLKNTTDTISRDMYVDFVRIKHKIQELNVCIETFEQRYINANNNSSSKTKQDIEPLPRPVTLTDFTKSLIFETDKE